MLFSGCTTSQQIQTEFPDGLFVTTAWPPKPTVNEIEYQDGVAEYVTKGKSAYDDCRANLDEIKQKLLTDYNIQK